MSVDRSRLDAKTRELVRADDRAESIALWLKVGMLGFVGYALSRHLGWQDAVATTFVLVLTLRALGTRGRS